MWDANARDDARSRRAAAASLYAAGFTTAFGAYSIAANLGGHARRQHKSLLALGLLPALYDGAEVLLAVTSALAQPLAGRARDAGRVTDAPGMAAGLLLPAAELACTGLLPGMAGLIPAALLAGAATPLAFAALAATAPPVRLGQTMGAAEVGRELGDAGGPLLVGAAASAVALPAGLLTLAALLAAVGAVIRQAGPRSRAPTAMPGPRSPRTAPEQDR